MAHVGITPPSGQSYLPDDEPIVIEFYELVDEFPYPPGPGTLVAHYTYFLCHDAATTGSFYCPRGPMEWGAPDLLFYHESDGRMRVYPTRLANVGGNPQTSDVNAVFSDSGWILPYNDERVCQYYNSTSCDAAFHRDVPFITPQVGPSFTLTADEDLKVPQGATWSWRTADEVTALRFPAGRKLVVEGALSATGVTFTSAVANPTTQERWGGIVTYAGVVGLDGVTVSNATTGLDLRSAGNAISGSLLMNNTTGIRTDFVTHNSKNPPRSTFTLLDSRIAGGSGVGIYALNTNARIEGTCVESNGGNGLAVASATIDPFLENSLRLNGAVTDGSGASVLSGGALYLGPADAFGQNRIASNTTSEVFLSAGGYAFAGFSSTSGRNAILDPNGGALVYAPSGMTVQARYNWWGASPPPSGSFPGPGTVSRAAYLSTDPTSDACSASFAGGGSSALLAGGASATAGAGAEAGASGLEELRAEIRRLRSELTAGPGASGAAGLVRALFALQRADREDVLGERAATTAALTALRTRLDGGNLPAALRAAAEAALEAEAADALSREDYDTAEGLLAGYGEHVTGAAVRRALTLTRAFVVAADGRRAEAASLVAGVAAETPDAAEAREFAALAVALADGELFEPALAPGPGVPASVSMVVGPAALVVTPNPARGEAAVVLTLEAPAAVRVALYDVLGREVALLAEGEFGGGAHALTLDGSGLPAGVYVVRAEVRPDDGTPRVLTRRLSLLD